uniref:Uncharacterized protein n=1 Tax=Nicotiana tabacum TaxID=4097 RepID=A0A1S4CN46_TOBAC|nr:PREDICTED: uncharacterized protein LOC107820861 [Nicotiana tabacum]
MHAYNRLPSSGHNSPSTPSSPRSRSPRLRSTSNSNSGGGSRVKPSARFTPGQPGPRTLAHRLAWVILSVLLRRQGIFLFAPLLYIAGMLFYMGTVSFDVVPNIRHHPAPGSLYRSPQLYAKLRPEMDSDNSTAHAISTIWKNSYRGGEWRPCINKSSGGRKFGESNLSFILVSTLCCFSPSLLIILHIVSATLWLHSAIQVILEVSQCIILS